MILYIIVGLIEIVPIPFPTLVLRAHQDLNAFLFFVIVIIDNLSDQLFYCKEKSRQRVLG